jgi:Cu2+-exporting ATPase
VGIAPEHVLAEALPQQKLKMVQALQQHGRRVAFIGDGVNDIAAMLQADVAISLGSATDSAQESADIVLMHNNLQDLLTAREIADHALHLLHQNKVLVVSTNASAILYGTMAVLNPIAAVALNNGTALAAALNSLRPAQKSSLARPAQNGNALPTHPKMAQKKLASGVAVLAGTVSPKASTPPLDY